MSILPVANSSRPKANNHLPPSNAVSRSADRKRIIFRALHDCILKKGYVKTTLADIASESGMSASHLLYYFRGKEAMLEQYFADVSVMFLDNIGRILEEPIDAQLILLADFWFNNEANTKQEIGFMLECFGVAVNDAALLNIKISFDAKFKEQLGNFLTEISHGERSPAAGRASDLAEVVYALIIGLRSAVYFNAELGLEAAHGLFCSTVLDLISIDSS